MGRHERLLLVVELQGLYLVLLHENVLLHLNGDLVHQHKLAHYPRLEQLWHCDGRGVGWEKTGFIVTDLIILLFLIL